jgi:hypothetical protein
MTRTRSSPPEAAITWRRAALVGSAAVRYAIASRAPSGSSARCCSGWLVSAKNSVRPIASAGARPCRAQNAPSAARVPAGRPGSTAECDGYTGAELEQAIIDAMYQAFAGDRDVATGDIIAAIARTVPLSKSQREVIERLRAWLRDGRAQSVSFAAASLAEQAQVRLELD